MGDLHDAVHTWVWMATFTPPTFERLQTHVEYVTVAKSFGIFALLVGTLVVVESDRIDYGVTK